MASTGPVNIEKQIKIKDKKKLGILFELLKR